LVLFRQCSFQIPPLFIEKQLGMPPQAQVPLPVAGNSPIESDEVRAGRWVPASISYQATDIDDGIRFLVSYQEAFSDFPGIAYSALRYWLAMCPENRDNLVAGGVVERVLSIVQRHIAQEHVVEIAMNFLVCIQSPGQDETSHVYAASVLDNIVATVVSVMRTFPVSPTIQRNGVFVLVRLVANETDGDIFIGRGVIGVMISTLISSRDSSIVSMVTSSLLLLAYQYGGIIKREIETASGTEAIASIEKKGGAAATAAADLLHHLESIDGEGEAQCTGAVCLS
jgi:hypothetical protein